MRCLLICLALLVPSWSLAQTIPVSGREGENGGEKVDHGSGGMILLRAA